MAAFKDIGYSNDINLEVNLWSVNENTMQSFLNLSFDCVTELKNLLEK